MEALRTQAVCKVACGAWHTAAIASPLPDGGDSLHGLPFIERIAVQHKLAAMYELTEEVPPTPWFHSPLGVSPWIKSVDSALTSVISLLEKEQDLKKVLSISPNTSMG